MQECLNYSLEGSSDENWENKKHYVCSLYEEKYLGLGHYSVYSEQTQKSLQIFFVNYFYLMKTVLCLSYYSCTVLCSVRVNVHMRFFFFCLELPYLKAKHLLKAFWIHSHLLWRQGICLVQLSPSLLLSHKAAVWFTSSSYAQRLILLASAPL